MTCLGMQGNEERTDTDTSGEKRGSVGCAHSNGSSINYSTALNLSVSILDSEGVGLSSLWNFVGSRLCLQTCTRRELVSAAGLCPDWSVTHKHSYLHTLSTFVLGPEKGLPPELGVEGGLRALIWPCPCQQFAFTQGFL